MEFGADALAVTQAGRYLLRNVVPAFDAAAGSGVAPPTDGRYSRTV